MEQNKLYSESVCSLRCDLHTHSVFSDGTYTPREIVTEAIPATGHSGDPVETPPTCTQEGFEGYTCQICGEKVVQEQLAATGHSFGSWEFDWSSGKNVRSCHCGEREYRASALYPILAVGVVLLVTGVILLVMRRKRTKA